MGDIRFSCENCGKTIRVPATMANRRGKCPGCATSVTVPSVDNAVQDWLSQPLSSETRPTLAPSASRAVPPPIAAVASTLPSQPSAIEPANALQLIACPFCAEEINAAAKKCKHCGEFLKGVVPPVPKRKWYKPSRAAKYFLGFLFVVSVIGRIGDGNRSGNSSGLDTAHKLQMIKAAQKGVLRVLKAPGSAEFPSPTFSTHEYSVTAVSDGTYRVRGYVDAQNSFGAKLRNNWEAICKGSGMNWYASSVTLLD